jgi:propanol-preferring alcohol dehydrogenase
VRALQYDGHALALVDRPEPRPGPGQAVVAVRGAGLCHSDLTVMGRPADSHPFPLPMVLGHELAGTVVEVAPGVTSVRVGDAVAGYGPRGCGACRPCMRGEVSYCRRRPAGLFPPGLGADGALAEYVAVDARDLHDASGIDPLQAAALTDAGLTAHHAVRRALGDQATYVDHTVVVIGVGGLGHAAVQLLSRAGVGTIVGVDVTEAKRLLATELGATHVLAADDDLVAHALGLTGGEGADVVLDFVASDATLAAAARMVAVGGVVSVVGVGSGVLPVAMHALPLGTRVDLPFWGSRADLHDVLGLARAGDLVLRVTPVGLDQAVAAYDRLQRGEILGRAVVRPDRSVVA